ncbi:hypothetical protein [Vibrio sp. OPT20]|uniref:hypothetical protein n=1 Tax=Vibrio sp. OPT20 TaxID=2778642 RepID=UPI00187F50C4|nr:hypothetical protein [Vibrio sp. OPT20]MBE8563789.1 hypothetical protein [Vibrio sp. OPT20]
MYQQEFKVALERTKRFNLKSPYVTCQDVRFLTYEFMTKFPRLLQQYIGLPTEDDVVAKCLEFHYKLQQPISEIIGVPCEFTIGHIESKDQKLFYQSETDLLALLQNGFKGSTLNIHAWLTLPSMEILDLTFPTSYAKINNIKGGAGGIIASHADELSNGVKYHPMLVGEDFLRQSGAMFEFIEF